MLRWMASTSQEVDGMLRWMAQQKPQVLRCDSGEASGSEVGDSGAGEASGAEVDDSIPSLHNGSVCFSR